MELRPFRHSTASSLEEAASLLSEPGSRAVAGGTDLLGVLQSNIHPDYPGLLVDLKGIPGLNRIRRDRRGLRIGALATLAEVAEHPLVRESHPALATAARSVASPQIRNVATVGGNICQEPRCWYYRYPENRFHCARKGGNGCPAATGENRYHSVFGARRAVDPPCARDCPAHIDIADYLARLRAGDRDGAARLVLNRNPLPAVTGRVCPHYCEADCNRVHYDQAVSVRAVERGIGDWVLDHPARFYRAPRRRTGRQVAVVGSGPAGLAAAYHLRRLGHDVTVYEAMPEAGGMLVYGIPAYRLPPEVVRRQVSALAVMGIGFRVGARVGSRGLSLTGLRRRHDAIFLATGAWVQGSLGLPHEDLLTQGLDFLRGIRQGAVTGTGRRVLVIGGGNVALDVAISALRLGAEQVTAACLEGREQMPAFPEDVEQAMREEVRLLPGWGPRRVLARRGKLTGVELARCTRVFDETGHFAPVIDPSQTRAIEADKVILAIGQGPDLSYATPSLRVLGRLEADPETGATATAGVFGGGDAAGGPATVAAAVADGRRAALAIDRYLGGRGTLPGVRPGRVEPNPASYPHSAAAVAEPIPAGERSLDGEDVPTPGWPILDAEARRCFNCGGCVAVNASDVAAVLVALGATIHTTQRALSAEAFFTVAAGSTTILRPGELVREVFVPAARGDRRQIYLKFRTRQAIDFPTASVAATLSVAEGVVSEARITLGAAGPVPVRAAVAERHLIGRVLTTATARQAAALAVGDCHPLPENGYKVAIIETLVRRALQRLARPARAGAMAPGKKRGRG